MHNNLLFIDDFKTNQQFATCKLIVDSHGRCPVKTTCWIVYIWLKEERENLDNLRQVPR